MDRSALSAAQPIVHASDAAKIAALRGVVLEPADVSTEPAVEEPYYWDDGGDPSPTVGKVIRHNVHWIAFGTLHAMEFVGDFFSNTLGLTNSRYEWALELARRQEEERLEREMAEERQERWEEIRRLNELEAKGNGGGAAAPVVGAAEGVALAGQEDGEDEDEEDDDEEEEETDEAGP